MSEFCEVCECDPCDCYDGCPPDQSVIKKIGYAYILKNGTYLSQERLHFVWLVREMISLNPNLMSNL